jgi:L-histidine N-alpha-methyltransferase
MSSVVNVAIHSSQFPEKVRRDLLESLRARAVNHKFHYDSVKQTQKWLALHQIHSPSRNDADCAAIYDKAFDGAAARLGAKEVHLIGLGCGGGQKDTRLLRLLKDRGTEIFYTPCDVSTAMVLTARQTALAVLAEDRCFPVVCDLLGADDLPAIFQTRTTHHAPRLTTFFGMVPNFEPEMILPKLASLVDAEDWLLFSANLAPGKDYGAGVNRVLPQYDNALTRDWLLAFLFDLGVEASDGELRFVVEEFNGLKRIVARFHIVRPRTVAVENEQFEFRAGESIRLFFSYRYTPELVRKALGQHGLAVMEQWVAKSEEEGVFLCRRKTS